MKLIILRSDLQILKQSFSSFSRESLVKSITNLKIAELLWDAYDFLKKWVSTSKSRMFQNCYFRC